MWFGWIIINHNPPCSFFYSWICYIFLQQFTIISNVKSMVEDLKIHFTLATENFNMYWVKRYLGIIAQFGEKISQFYPYINGEIRFKIHNVLLKHALTFRRTSCRKQRIQLKMIRYYYVGEWKLAVWLTW